MINDKFFKIGKKYKNYKNEIWEIFKIDEVGEWIFAKKDEIERRFTPAYFKNTCGEVIKPSLWEKIIKLLSNIKNKK